MKNLVDIVNNKPLASSLVIADGMGVSHKSVIQLVRKYLPELRSFGLMEFEMRPRLEGKHGGGDVEFALLNEQQATFLISLMRNSDEVVEFKLNLIKEFYKMRDALHHVNSNLYRQYQELSAEEDKSFQLAQIGSHLMLNRRKEKLSIAERIERIERELQLELEYDN